MRVADQTFIGGCMIMLIFDMVIPASIVKRLEWLVLSNHQRVQPLIQWCKSDPLGMGQAVFEPGQWLQVLYFV